MTNLPQRVVKNSNDWNEAINQLIDVCADLQGEAPTISDWSKDGIVLLDGTTWQPNCMGYRTINFKHAKFVQLDLKLQQSTKNKAATAHLAQLPDSIALSNMSETVSTNTGLPGIGVCFAVATLTVNRITQNLVIPSVPSDGWSGNTVISVTYLCTNN